MGNDTLVGAEASIVTWETLESFARAKVQAFVQDLTPSLDHLAKALRKKSREFKSVVKAGRTHLMDATPVTLGQEFGCYAAAIEHGI